MSFRMNCPHCKTALNIAEKALGKTAPCPGCNQPVTVPEQPMPLPPSGDGHVSPPMASPTNSVARIKIPCPFCGDSIKYEESLGGKTIACGYCKNALNLPIVAQLPPEYQAEFQRVQHKLRKKAQVAELKRLKAQEKEERQQAQRSAESVIEPPGVSTQQFPNVAIPQRFLLITGALIAFVLLISVVVSVSQWMDNNRKEYDRRMKIEVEALEHASQDPRDRRWKGGEDFIRAAAKETGKSEAEVKRSFNDELDRRGLGGWADGKE